MINIEIEVERYKKHIEDTKDPNLEAEVLKQLQVAAPCGEGLAQFVFSLQERFPHNRRHNSQFWAEIMFWMRKAWYEAKDGIIWSLMLSLEILLYGSILVLGYFSFTILHTTLVNLMPSSGPEVWICMQVCN